MSKKIVVRLEIGDNLKESIGKLIETVDRENKRISFWSLHPGREIQEAFGINFTKIAKRAIKSGKAKVDISV